MAEFKSIIKAFGDRIPDNRKEAATSLILYINTLIKNYQNDSVLLVYDYLCDLLDKQPESSSKMGCIHAFGAFAVGIVIQINNLAKRYRS